MNAVSITLILFMQHYVLYEVAKEPLRALDLPGAFGRDNQPAAYLLFGQLSEYTWWKTNYQASGTS
jgi:hypothetical protein